MQQYDFQRRRLNEIPEVKMLEELEKAAKHFNYIEFSYRDFNKIEDRSLSASVIKKHFNGWKK